MIIEIKHKFNANGSFMKTYIISNLMELLNSSISSQTPLNYHSKDLDLDSTITIPVDILNKNENNKNIVNEKIELLKNYLENEINYDMFSLRAKAIMASIMRYNFDWENVLYIEYDNKKTPIKLKKPNIEPLKIESHLFNDNSTITEIKNKYINDGIIIVDLCVPYNELNFGYNVLHFYEHITCSPWFDNRKNNNVVYTNGFTSSLAHCYVYAIIKDVATFEEYLYSMITWLCESRNNKFWLEHKNDLERETLRTISETKYNESFSSFARSSGTAYEDVLKNDIYLNALNYWANKPFKLFIRHPFELTLDKEKINKLIKLNPLNKVEKPKVKKFNYYPYEVLTNSNSSQTMVTEKIKPEDVAKIHYDYLEHDKIEDGMFGIDVCYKMINKTDFFNDISNDAKIFNYYPIFILSTMKQYYTGKQYKEMANYLNIDFYTNDSLLNEQYITNDR